LLDVRPLPLVRLQESPSIAVFFPPHAIQVEGKDVDPATNQGFIDMLGFPEGKLPARQKLWAWIVQCLHGPKHLAQPGPFYYLTHQCVIYDISLLFKRLWDVLETVTICSLDDEVV